MVLSTHAIVGAGSAILLRNYPILGLIAAFFSHFLLDSIPHWHYRLLSREKNNSFPFGEKLNFGANFVKDIFRTGIDFCIGLALSLFVSQNFFPGYFWLTAFGAFAGALPDLLQVIYYRFRNFAPLFYFQKFHEKVHAKRHLDDELTKGIFYQAALSAAIVFILILIA